MDVFNKIPNQLNVTAIETVLENKITIYKIPKNRQKLARLVKEFKNIQINKGQMVKIPKKDWIIIPLVDNQEDKYKAGKVYIYILSQPDKNLINQKFNKIYNQGKINWINKYILFIFLYFIIWKKL